MWSDFLYFQVVLYDINRTKSRHHKRRDISLPTSAQCLNVMGDRLCVGFPSSFFIYSLWEDTPPFCKDVSLYFLLLNSPRFIFISTDSILNFLFFFYVIRVWLITVECQLIRLIKRTLSFFPNFSKIFLTKFGFNWRFI